MALRRSLTLTIAALGALVLAACADGADDAPEDALGDELPDELGDLDDLDDGDLGELDDLLGGDQDLPDPSEHVEDGVFRGDGIVLPIPEGFELEPAFYMQGLVAAVTPDGLRQIAGQAVDTETVPEPLDIDGIAEANEEQFGPPAADEETQVDGAARARQLRFEGIPAQQQDQPDLTVLLIIAEDGDGEIAIFNVVAPADEWDDDEAEAMLAGVGFDPDSSPPAFDAPPAP